MQQSPRIFYGWWLVLVCLLIQGIAVGVTIYTYSIIAGEAERAFSASRAVVMLGMTGQSIMTGLLAPKMGDLLDRVSIKGTIIATALIMGLGFTLISFTPSVWGFVAGYTLLIPAGASVLGMMAASVLLSRWFVRHRGLAIGIAALGTQLGGFTIPPLVASLIDAFDWRIALRAIGLSVAILIPLLAYWTIVDRPADRGLAPDGDRPAPEPAQSSGADTEAAAGVSSLKPVLADRNFWLVGFGIAVMVAMFTTVLANLALFATDMGTPREQAALLISLYAAVGIVFSPIIGRLCDVIDIRLVFAGMLLINIAAMAGFVLAEDYPGLMIATAMVAVSGGGMTPLWSALIGKLFELRLYARVMGAMTLFTVTASSLAPLLSGWLFDLTGSYRILFLALIALMAIPLFYMPLIHKKDEAQSASVSRASG